MIDTLADLIPLYGMILVIGIWWFIDYRVNRKYSKNIKLLEYHNKLRSYMSEELNVREADIIELWFDKTPKSAKGFYVVDSKVFKDYIFILSYSSIDNKYVLETFIKMRDEVADF